MKRIAAFEKVSFAQYEKDFADAFPGHETAEIRAIYDDITKPNGRQREAQAMTFLHRWHLC